MKVRISPTGNLEIFRKYEYKVQTCCYHQYKACGDHCPMFREPYNEFANIHICLCQDRELEVSLKHFEDLRVKQEKERDYVFKDFGENM